MRRQRGLVPADPAADPRRFGVPRQGAGADRLLLRDRVAGIRPDVALPRAAYARPARFGPFRLVCGTFIGGIHPDTGRQYTIIEPQIGGWGARRARTATRPSSAASTARPTTARPRSTRPATASWSTDGAQHGARRRGRVQGGRGIVMDYRTRADNGFLTAWATPGRSFPPGRMDGGHEGSPNLVEFRQGRHRRSASPSSRA
jgi:hypothetical protein